LLNVISGLLAGGVAASTNSYESIATVTVGTAQSTISFTSIPSTYKHLQVRGLTRGTDASNGGVAVYMRLNGDTASNYSNHGLDAFQGASANTEAFGNANTTYGLNFYQPSAGNTASIFAGGVTDILDYQNTNKYKTTRSLGGYDMNGSTSGYNYIGIYSGSWRNTAAVTQIDLICSAGSFDTYSKFALYGIKG